MIEEFEKTACTEFNALMDLVLMNRLVKLPPKVIECKPRVYEKIEDFFKRKANIDKPLELVFDGIEIKKGTFLMSQPFQIIEFYGTI